MVEVVVVAVLLGLVFCALGWLGGSSRVERLRHVDPKGGRRVDEHRVYRRF